MTRSEYWDGYAKRLTKLEKKYAPKIYRALVQQLKAFTSALREGRTDQMIWNVGIGQVLRQMHVEGAIREGRHTMRMLREGVEVKRLGNNEEWTAEVIRLLQVHNANLVSKITETTREYLLAKLEEGLMEGMSLNEIADVLDREIEQTYINRSFAIARTELNRASNLGNRLAADKYEYETVKVWITAKDHRVRGKAEGDRFNHAVLDGQRVDVNTPFNNGENIMQPGDPNASAGNTINCRCTIAIVAKRDAQGRLIRKRNTITA